MSAEPSVAVILVNWNGYPDTAACLESLRVLAYRNYSVTIVDNASSDGSEEKFRQNHPECAVLQAGSNRGFAGGCNLGIRHALQYNPDYLLLLNNDTRVDPGLIRELVRMDQSGENIGITSGKVYFANPPDRVWCYGGSFNVNTGAAVHFLNEHEAAQVLKKPLYRYLPACLWLLKRRCVESVGLLSEEFFHLCEDVEYCLRLQQKGWKLALTPNAVVYHKGSAAMERFSPVYNYYEQRNRLYVIKKYRTQKRFALFQLFDCCVIAGRLCWTVFTARDLNGFLRNTRLVMKAVWDFLSGRTGKQF